ncbi:B-cell antigen receptor complex-associated protein beta chain [Carcharodon carcharias]|uniref:B-cell antigen receptor complex-associated protein beta chain n=1 Tax=Carcharodon carcharias TaxID=13397 RepID=UPI001B7F3CC7|nr:B-cell antigen receptor complex-associated protein beta chain [Carcharodon carcharias]
MALFTGTSCSVPGTLLFILSIATGGLCKDLKINYSVPYRAVKQGSQVTLSCLFENLAADLQPFVQWYKFNKEPIEVRKTNHGIITMNKGTSAWLYIEKATEAHSGIYYCSLSSMNETNHQCGAEVNVIMQPINRKKLSPTYTLKDMLILIQAILLILCLTLPGMLLLNKNNQAKRNEEAETYHMYEGLEVMQSAMYEDIGNVKSSSDAKWTIGEQPNE